MTSNPKKVGLFQQFANFLKTFGIIGLAIAFVIGNAASGLVQSMVNDIISPFIGLFLTQGSLQAQAWNITGISGTPSTFKVGDLVSQMINFVIIAFIVFLAYKELSKFKIVDDKSLSKE